MPDAREMALDQSLGVLEIALVTPARALKTKGTGMRARRLPVYMIHWNAPEWAGSAARSVLSSEGVDVALTVIDNPSDRSAELHSHLPVDVEVVHRAVNSGYAGGANEALRRWRSDGDPAEFCVLCSHDLHVCPDALAIMADTLAAHPDYGILEPTIWQGAPRGPLPGTHAPIQPVDWATGCCLMLRRDAVANIDFDGSFQSYVEDVDFCLRVRDAGWKVGLATRAVGWELGSATPRAEALVKANTVRLRAKRRGRVGGAAAVASLVGDSARSALGGIAGWRPSTSRTASRRRLRASLEALTLIARPSFWAPSPTPAAAVDAKSSATC